ncbi:MAG: glycoside hydrolase family 5 protein [Lachnospiraceae bacterium]|nr:glycoside hydrolase family 5 protein [Lachnospiraceae bacterium]
MKVKYVLKILLLIVLAAAFVAGTAYFIGTRMAYSKGETQRFVKQLGAGINVGNSLDVYDADVKEGLFEEAWGNPPLHKDLFKTIRAAGFKTVRIPVSWGDHVDDGFNVDPAWMSRVHEVVDMALDSGLYVIINSHHEPWRSLVTRNDAWIRYRNMLLWRQIAEEFKDYDERLLFEGMNEPRLIDSEMEWTDGDAGLKGFVNELNGDFVDTVRATGGKNSDRYLLVTTYAGKATDATVMVLKDFLDERKKDRRLIASVHMYMPYSFAQDEDGTDKWDQENPDDLKDIELGISSMMILRDAGYSVMLTEYGAKDKGNDEARIAWATYYAARCNYNGIARIWWDDGSDYALIDREKLVWKNTELNAIAAYSKE